MNPRNIINALLCVLASCGGAGSTGQAVDGGPIRAREPAGDAVAAPGRDLSGLESGADATPDRGAVEVLDLRPGVEASADLRSEIPWRTDRIPVCQANKVDGSHSSVATKEILGVVYNCVSSTAIQRAVEPVVPCLIIGAEWYMFLAGPEVDGVHASGCASGFEALQ